MAAFDFLLILLSFVTALALSQVLTSAGRMLVEHRRVRRPGLLGLAMLNAGPSDTRSAAPAMTAP